MNTHATVPGSQPTPSSIGLSPVQHSKKKKKNNLLDVTCEYYSNVTHSLYN